MVAQPFFADLRTKQQLGYLVSASGDFLNGMTGIRFRVQSANTKCDEIEKRILKFVEEDLPVILKSKNNSINNNIVSTNDTVLTADIDTSTTGPNKSSQPKKNPQEETRSTTPATSSSFTEFEHFKKGVISKLKEVPKRLSQEFAVHWTEIAMRSFHFDWKQKAIAILETLTFDEFWQFYENEFQKKPKLWLHVVGPVPSGTNKEEDPSKNGENKKLALPSAEDVEKIAGKTVLHVGELQTLLNNKI